MNKPPKNHPPGKVKSDRNQAQAAVEFALILPIALLMVFTIIEIARMAQAWLVVTNAARVGLRYAVTGAYEVSYCTSAIDVNGNGDICEQETDKDVRHDEIDAARLLSIYEQTEISAVGIMKDLSVTTYGEVGFFDVTVCSTNKVKDEDGNDIGTRVYKPEEVYKEVKGIPPDLIVYFGNLDWRAAGSVGTGEIYRYDNDTGPDDANHSPDGIFILKSPQVKPASQGNELSNLNIYDVAPTILSLMGQKIPADMIGKVIDFN